MAAEASGKQRREANARIVKATGDALHLLGWLRMALPLLSGGPSCSVFCRHLPSGQLPYVVETARMLACTLQMYQPLLCLELPTKRGLACGLKLLVSDL